jgi:hypothetical protein
MSEKGNLRRSLREIVAGERPSRLAMHRIDSPEALAKAISSRSANDR